MSLWDDIGETASGFANNFWGTSAGTGDSNSLSNYTGSTYNPTDFLGSSFGDLASEGVDNVTSPTANYAAPTVWDNLSSIGKTVSNNASGWLANPDKSVISGESGGVSPTNIFKSGLGLYDYLQKRSALNSAESYANQLANLQANPDSFKSSAAYQAAESSAINAARRQAAASGTLGSTNILNNIQKTANNTALQWYNQEASRLAQLSNAANSAAALKTAKTDQLTGSLSQYAKMFGLI